MAAQSGFKPFIAPEVQMKELTLKSLIVGGLFGIIFGASTVYLALKAGLTVSASIPIAVLSIALGKMFLKTTILENNIIQTGIKCLKKNNKKIVKNRKYWQPAGLGLVQEI